MTRRELVARQLADLEEALWWWQHKGKAAKSIKSDKAEKEALAMLAEIEGQLTYWRSVTDLE